MRIPDLYLGRRFKFVHQAEMRGRILLRPFLRQCYCQPQWNFSQISVLHMTFANAAEMRFFHDIFQEYARRHALWANFLRLNEQDAAAVWCVKHQGVMYGLQTVYDQRYKSYAPGSYLLQKGLISLEAAGDLRFDFMGNQPYKKYLSNGRCCYYDVYILPGNCYGRLLSRLGRLSSSRLQPFTSEF